MWCQTMHLDHQKQLEQYRITFIRGQFVNTNQRTSHSQDNSPPAPSNIKQARVKSSQIVGHHLVHRDLCDGAVHERVDGVYGASALH